MKKTKTRNIKRFKIEIDYFQPKIILSNLFNAMIEH